MTVIAIDAGTSAIKVAAVSSEGCVTAVAREAVPASPSTGNDLDSFWSCVTTAIRSISDQVDSVDAIAVTGQGDGLWAIDSSGNPAGPAHEWNSSVAAEIIRGWEIDGTLERHYDDAATVLWPGTTAAIWNWLESAEPEHAKRTQHVFCAKDWINFKLSGVIATDVTDATIPFLNLETGSYSQSAIERLGCTALADKLAPIVPQASEIGTLTADAANITGLTAGTPVVMGCLDVVALTLGVGLAQTGDALAVLGTTAAAMVLTEVLDRTGENVGATLRLQPDNKYLRIMGSNSGTSTLDWYLRTNEMTIDEFWEDVQAGTSGVTMMPYLAGERVPFLAPDATGAFLGVTPQTTRSDMSRAVVHGITHSLRHCLDFAQRSESTLVLTGGGSASSQWCQLVADVTQRRVEVDNRAHIACVGLASLVSGSTPTAQFDRVSYDPQVDLTDEFESFVELGQMLRPVWAEMASPQNRKDP